MCCDVKFESLSLLSIFVCLLSERSIVMLHCCSLLFDDLDNLVYIVLHCGVICTLLCKYFLDHSDFPWHFFCRSCGMADFLHFHVLLSLFDLVPVLICIFGLLGHVRLVQRIISHEFCQLAFTKLFHLNVKFSVFFFLWCCKTFLNF